MNESVYDKKAAIRDFTRVGIAFSVLLVIWTGLQLAWTEIPEMIWGPENWFNTSSWSQWLATIIPLYIISMPVCVLILKKLPAQKPEDHKLGFWRFLMYIPICFCLMYTGNIVGILVSLVLSGGQAENGVVEIVNDTNPLKVVVVVILAPLLEEYICRKQIIDRTRKYGEKVAVILSAVIFGLMHQNFFQFFYAFALGLIFGYLYTRTGRLRYSVIIHTFINFLSAVVVPWLMQWMDMEALARIPDGVTEAEFVEIVMPMLPSFVALTIYAAILILISLVGLVLFIIRCVYVKWQPAALQLPKGKAFPIVYLNWGMLLYLALCVASFIWALL